MVLTTLKEFADYFQQDLNDPASILIAIEKTIFIIGEEHKSEIKYIYRNDLNKRKNDFKLV